MSIATMTRLVSPAPAPGAPEGVQRSTSEIQQTALEKIIIPSEVIGIYVAGLGILSGSEASGPEKEAGIGWALFVFCLLVIPVIVAVNVQLRKRASGTEAGLGWSKVALLCAFAALAFAAWTAALPDTPFLDLHPYANRIGAFAVVVLGVLMPGVAQLLGLIPES
jgi:hypothetical protein